MADTCSPINIISLICKGIKGTLDYAEHLLQNECDFMFVCEHSLKLCDLYQMNSHFREQSYWCNLKSSVPADEGVALCVVNENTAPSKMFHMLIIESQLYK